MRGKPGGPAPGQPHRGIAHPGAGDEPGLHRVGMRARCGLDPGDKLGNHVLERLVHARMLDPDAGRRDI